MNNPSYTVICGVYVHLPSSYKSVLIFGQSNVIIDSNGYSRICDYGLAVIMEPSEFTSIKTTGACRWTAPDIMDPPEDVVSANHSTTLFTTESDVYAFGMTVLEVILDYMVY